MNVNQISEPNFKGKIIYNRRLKKPMIDYSNKILDIMVSGKTARERIKNSTYNLHICRASSKKAIYPRIFFQSYFYRIGKDNRYVRYSPDLRIDYDKEIGAKRLHKFLDLFEENKKELNGYNTWWEKIRALFKKP